MSDGPSGSGTVRTGQEGNITLVLGNPDFCQIQTAILYASASSFVSPVAAHKRIYQEAITRATAPGNLLFAVGHTDDVGGAADNIALSQRRARGALAVLTDNTAEWETNFRNPNERWTDADFQTMLTEVGSPSDPQSIRQHRDLTPAGQALRATLFTNYFRSLRSSAAAISQLNSLTPPFLGCGEQHALGTGEHAPSRRAEFFFFLTGTPTSPATPPTVNCSQYPTWHNPCALIPIVPPALTDFFVSVVGDNATGNGSRARPWQTIRHSFTQIAILRQPGQHITLNVLPGTYAENVVMPTNTTLLGIIDPIPEIRGQGGGEPAIRINNVNNSNVRNLIVTRGDLSGIRITTARDITVADCVITQNFAPRGGGVAIINSNQVTIDNNTIELNTAGTIATAITRVAIDATVSFELDVFEMEVGDAHGGGVYSRNSGEVQINRNVIRNNTAILFGGGVAVDNQPEFSGTVEIAANQIVCNQCSHASLAPLGANVNCALGDMNDPVVDRMEEETIDAVAARAANLLHGVGIESGLGGGIALRHVTPGTVVSGNIIGREGEPNRARRGGGIECFVGAYPTIRGNSIDFNLSSDDGGGIAIDQFDPFLPASQPVFFGFRRGPIFPRLTIRMINNSIRSNRSRSDGGGIYATGNPRVEISGQTTISDNQAGENGGGIRVSYAARLTVNGATISGNRCHTLSTERDGGGGIAARNSEVVLRNCSLSNNISPDFAGGGAFFTSTFEGGFGPGGFIGNEFGQFDLMQQDDFLFHTRRYHLHDCRGNDNQTLGAAGAGGFMYAVRVEGTEVMEVSIRGASTSILTNTSTFDRGGGNRQKRGNVVIDIPLAQPAGLPGDRFFITADVPSIAAGGIQNSTPAPDNHPVVVIRNGGIDRPTTFPFALGAAPHISDLQPRFGPIAGRQQLTITGESFMDGVVVTIDGRPATVTTVTDTSIVFTTPAGALGAVDVVVTNPDGQSATVALGFEYVAAPTILDVQPREGPPSGGTQITIAGTGFRPRVRVLIGRLPALNIILVSTTSITAETPRLRGVSGRIPVDVEVVNEDNQSERVTGGFTYVTSSPSITNIQPRSGPSTIGIPFTVDGSDFLNGAEILIGGQQATNLVVVSSTRIIAQTPVQPAVSGLVDVVLRNPDGGSDTIGAGFEYIPPPQISDVQPRVGTAGTFLRITGTQFQSGIAVTLDGLPATNITFVSATEVTANAPPHSAGAVEIAVSNTDGQRESVPLGFTYQ